MTKLIKIFAIASGMLVFAMSCEKQEIVDAPIVASPQIDTNEENVSKNLRGTNYSKKIINPFKYKSVEQIKYESGWAPSPVLNKPSTWTINYTSEKMNEVTASVSSSICTKGEIITLFAQACVEAAATLKTSLSQATTVTRKENLKAYEQARYKVVIGYDFFKGTLVITPFNGYGPGSIAPMSYDVYWKIPKYTYATTEKRMTK